MLIPAHGTATTKKPFSRANLNEKRFLLEVWPHLLIEKTVSSSGNNGAAVAMVSP